MNCHRRDCVVSMRQVDAFPRLCANGFWWTAVLVAALAAVFAGLTLLA